MPQVRGETPCVICDTLESVMNSHHTVPRCRGGEDSLQIILCPSCHDVLHANALHVLARIRNPKLPVKAFWKNVKEEENAQRWLQILVSAFLQPIVGDIKHLVSCSLETEDFRLFKELAGQLGCSQEHAVEYCIKLTLAHKGIQREKAMPELWFVPVSKPGKSI